jgi:hypothetical protein
MLLEQLYYTYYNIKTQKCPRGDHHNVLSPKNKTSLEEADAR